MYNLADINVIKYLLNKYGFSFSKGLGQNFIVNKEICPKIANEAILSDEMGVIEIGPGMGVLTSEIAKRAKKVVAIELDSRLIPILNDTLSDFKNVKLINADFLKLDINKLIEDEFQGMKAGICANLPYYITSPIIMKILEDKANIDFIVSMVQKEAAQRICAEAGTRECGAISLAVRYYSEPRILFDVGRENFIPSPNVDSSVIRLDIKNSLTLEENEEKNFFKLIKCAFGKRRKTLLNSLSGNFCMGKHEIEKILQNLEIPLKSRAEQLSFDNFIKLSKKIR